MQAKGQSESLLIMMLGLSATQPSLHQLAQLSVTLMQEVLDMACCHN
jgi:hypothetical protein